MQAVERMCESSSPARITMRAVAAEAGVSVGLAYHHFESKDDLIGATLDRLASQIATRAVSVEQPAEGMLLLWELLAEFSAFPRIVHWLIEADRDVMSLMSGHPLIRDMTGLAATRGHPDPETAGALVALLVMAGAVDGPTVNRATGRDATDARLYQATAGMLESWLIGATGRPTPADRPGVQPPSATPQAGPHPAVWPPSMLMAAPVT